jgi:hypothetical protein
MSLDSTLNGWPFIIGVRDVRWVGDGGSIGWRSDLFLLLEIVWVRWRFDWLDEWLFFVPVGPLGLLNVHWSTTKLRKKVACEESLVRVPLHPVKIDLKGGRGTRVRLNTVVLFSLFLVGLSVLGRIQRTIGLLATTFGTFGRLNEPIGIVRSTFGRLNEPSIHFWPLTRDLSFIILHFTFNILFFLKWTNWIHTDQNYDKLSRN